MPSEASFSIDAHSSYSLMEGLLSNGVDFGGRDDVMRFSSSVFICESFCVCDSRGWRRDSDRLEVAWCKNDGLQLD